MTKRFVDDHIDHKEDDIEKIQTKPNMYISYKGRRGALHLAKELINNMVDESINPESPANVIDILLDETDNTLAVYDNGRGMPFHPNAKGQIPMELACTKLQSSSKFKRATGGSTAGENGVGLTAVNALSERFEIVSKRYGERATLKFEHGKKAQPLKIKKIDSDEHGTMQMYKPSEKYMGKDCRIDLDDLLLWVEKLTYMLPKEVTINFNAKRIGKEASLKKKFKNKNGMFDYIKKIVKKPLFEPVHILDTTTVTEMVINEDTGEEEEVERFIGLEFAFTFNSEETDTPTIDTFCNFVNTVENGQHLDAVQSAITQYLTKQTRESLSERDAKKLDITSADVLRGLGLTLYVNTTMNPEFASQTKEKVSREELFNPLKTMARNGLAEYFRKFPKELKRATDYIKMNAKARYEANKARNSVVKKTLTNLDEHKIKGFTPAIARGKAAYRELLLIEGDSAQGSVDEGRYNEFQASYGLRGVPLNTFDASIDSVLKNVEFKALVQILKCNIGKAFDIKKLPYNKIIIMTDADVDGRRISSLICAFFIRHMPEIVEAGLLYKAVAPLYKIEDKERPFLLSKVEFIEVFESRIGNNIKLESIDGKAMTSKEFREFLFVNRIYLDEMVRVATHFAVNRDIIETILAVIPDMTDTSITDAQYKAVKAALAKRFPELEIDKTGVVSGVYQGQFQILTIDHLFFRRVETLHTLMHKYNGGKLIYRVREKVGKSYEDRGVLTIGQLMEMCQKFRPKILMRFKGLGELNPTSLSETTLNPANRILLQLSMDDVKKEIEKFSILHGDNFTAERKELMKHFKIDREDLDN